MHTFLLFRHVQVGDVHPLNQSLKKLAPWSFSINMSKVGIECLSPWITRFSALKSPQIWTFPLGLVTTTIGLPNMNSQLCAAPPY